MNDTHEVTMPVGDWLLIDGTVDNSVSIAAVDGDEVCVAMGHRVRAAGWAASAAHPRAGDGPSGWPPLDADITIGLPVADWRFVVVELAEGAVVSESTGDLEERDDSVRLEGFLRARLTGL